MVCVSAEFASRSHRASCNMQHAALTPPLLFCSDPPVSGATLQAQCCLPSLDVMNVKPVHPLLQLSGLHAVVERICILWRRHERHRNKLRHAQEYD